MHKNCEGFFEPYLADADSCTDCGICEKVCPVLNSLPDAPHNEKAYIVQNTDDCVRRESASGGFFSAIAASVLRSGGVVFGAAYGESFRVQHIGVDSEEELWRLRNSKYVQSDLSGVFPQVEKELLGDREVCFSGTPCQVEGLKCYLQKDYPNLLTVDVVCHGVSSQLIWEKYLETIQKYEPQKICFRWKHYGYKYSTMSVFDKEGRERYFGGVESDQMLRAYFSNNCDNNSCYQCRFKKRYRVSDITMWDCFQPKLFSEQYDDDKGTSCVLLNSDKGFVHFQRISEMGLVRSFQVEPSELTAGNREMISSVHKGAVREALISDALNLSGSELFDRYFSESMSVKTKRLLRLTLLKTGMYDRLKYLLFLYRRRKYR